MNWRFPELKRANGVKSPFLPTKTQYATNANHFESTEHTNQARNTSLTIYIYKYKYTQLIMGPQGSSSCALSHA